MNRRNIIATAQAYLHFTHVYFHSVIQTGGPRRRGRIARNWDFASSFTTTNKKSKENTNTKKEKCTGSQSLSCERTLLDLSLKSGDCLLYKEVYFRTASASFSSNSAAIFCVFTAGMDSAFVSSADRKTAEIFMLMFMLMHDRFTRVTYQHKHKHKKMANSILFSYAYAYVYVSSVHTYNSYAYVYSYAFSYDAV